MIVVIWYLANNWQMQMFDVLADTSFNAACIAAWITFIGQHDDSPVSNMIEQDVK